MLKLKKCAFCGHGFRSRDGSNATFCPKCSDERRKIAGQEFLSTSGNSVFIEDYLLSQKQLKRIGQIRLR